MKHFVISLILFASLVTAVTLNAVKVNEKICIVSRLAELLPDVPDMQKTKNLRDKWEEYRGFLSMSLNTSELERTEEFIGELYASSEINDLTSYALAKEKLINSLHGLDDGENISFYGIF